jgi:hypothetical protein
MPAVPGNPYKLTVSPKARVNDFDFTSPVPMVPDGGEEDNADVSTVIRYNRISWYRCHIFLDRLT